MQQHSAIGIDLGTTYSALAVINPAGKPEIVPNAEGERTTASAVYFAPEEHVGQIAIDAAGAYPDRVARWVKREMGTDWSTTIDTETYSAVDISAKILNKIKQDVERVLGPIKKAVVTVPAYFDEAPRVATKTAAEQAGFDVLRIINEPTAAALAYACSGQSVGTVLVYDFGGGTFDVSLVEIKSNTKVEVLCSDGDRRLGGYDLDMALAEHFDALFHAEHDVHLLDEGDPTTRHATIETAEKTKRQLSQMSERAGIPLQWKGTSMTVNVERSTFEELIANHIETTMLLVEAVLDETGRSVSDVDDVILVGGSTRIPIVEQTLTEVFGKPPLKLINPDEAVALGAALQAAILLEKDGIGNLSPEVGEPIGKIDLTDVTNHSYGTTCVETGPGTEYRLKNDIIIQKNARIPCSVTKEYLILHDNQTEVDCDVTQGEGEDPEFVKMIRSGTLSVPPGRKKGCEVAVTFSYDANQIMACEFKDVESGRVEQFQLHGVEGPAESPSAAATRIEGLDDLEL